LLHVPRPGGYAGTTHSKEEPMTDQPAPAHDDLPLPDYDHVPLGSLEGRIRSLDAGALGQLLAYEQQHGNRLPVVQILQRRLDGLAAGAEPSSGSPGAARPEVQSGQGGSKVSPATSGPAMNPPSQGDPTNPAQPRS
jgi:hypothetical protein